jgi:hypothetical protein
VLSIGVSVQQPFVLPSVGNFQQKNNSAEDGIDGTKGYFRRNSDCCAEQKILEIPFRTLPRKRKQLGIPFRGAKKKQTLGISFRTPFKVRENSSKFRSVEQIRSKLSEFPSEPFRFSGRENNWEFRSVEQK